MCGLLGAVAKSPVNQLLYDGLQVLQHRGQDAAGIVTADGPSFHIHKGSGLVRDVFRTRNMRVLVGNSGIGHCRYPTAGSANAFDEVQPMYVNSPFGIVLGHNGNLTNCHKLKIELFRQDLRHVNTNSDSEVLLNVFAHELQKASVGVNLTTEAIFEAVRGVHKRVQGAYSVVAMISGYGLLAFRDPFGIRPLVYGVRNKEGEKEYLVSSETVALDTLGFDYVRDIEPGEALFISNEGNVSEQQCVSNPSRYPCIFEYVYLARPDSVIDGISVHETRMRMGERLAKRIRSEHADIQIDVVIPIPDSSRPSAMEIADGIEVPYREGFIKNRYIGRTFIMPGQEVRKKSVRQKLNAIASEFKGKNVLLVDDSIVRGTTSKEIVQMAREAGAKQVYFASAAPPVRYPNVYGIDMPSSKELIAHGRDEEAIAAEIGVDRIIYQTVEDLIESCAFVNPEITQFETSCFTGEYITGDISKDYLISVEGERNDEQISSVLQSKSILDLDVING
ncbi:MAG: amidophosphoribosyltransferase [Burkholderiales bacterium]|nr:amidophosphoribosyltransferase [Burkholderiales bacterium]